MDLLSKKYEEAGDWKSNCNVMETSNPLKVLGATFFTNLTLPYLNVIIP